MMVWIWPLIEAKVLLLMSMYAGNLLDIADMLEFLREKKEIETMELSEENIASFR